MVSAGCDSHLIRDDVQFRLGTHIQDEQLFISDPRALYHIYVKDQDTFEVTTASIMYVRLF